MLPLCSNNEIQVAVIERCSFNRFLKYDSFLLPGEGSSIECNHELGFQAFVGYIQAFQCYLFSSGGFEIRGKELIMQARLSLHVCNSRVRSAFILRAKIVRDPFG